MSFVTNGRKNDRAPVKDEDLSLFRELHQQKHRNLLHSLAISEEFDTAFPFPTHPLNGNYQILRIPSTKKGSIGSDFFAENNKHDYNWLKTPPATPLFPSIEMEAAANNNNNNKNIIATQEQQKKNEVTLAPPLLQQPLSRFAGGNNSELSSRSSNSISILKPAQRQKSKSTTTKNDAVQKPSPSTLASKSTGSSTAASSKERPSYHSNIVGIFSNETQTPPNLRPERRSSSTTRGRGAVAPLRSVLEEPTSAKPLMTKPTQKSRSPSVTRGRIKAEATNNKQEINSSSNSSKGSVVVGSRMVEKVINARKSATYNTTTSTISSTSTSNIVGDRLKLDHTTKPNNSRPNQKSAFGLAVKNSYNNNNNVNINNTKTTREKARSK